MKAKERKEKGKINLVIVITLHWSSLTDGDFISHQIFVFMSDWRRNILTFLLPAEINCMAVAGLQLVNSGKIKLQNY